ncbi:MAG: hypothetical protein ACMUIG_06005 [Thermoplasmatota archaeon]
MARWDVHLSFGLLALVVIVSALVFSLFNASKMSGIGEGFGYFYKPIIIGGSALMVGSVLPDIDGKGNIRWIAGPVAGFMAFLPPFLGCFSSLGIMKALEFAASEGAVIFLIFTVSGYLFLLIPMKHRGIMHRTGTAVVFGAVIGIYTAMSALLSIPQVFLVFSMGTIGYWWHLALDGRFI